MLRDEKVVGSIPITPTFDTFRSTLDRGVAVLVGRRGSEELPARLAPTGSVSESLSAGPVDYIAAVDASSHDTPWEMRVGDAAAGPRDPRIPANS